MIAEHGEPVDHQFWMRVDELIVCHPQRIIHAAYAFEMMYISGGNYKFGAYFFGHGSHQLGYGLLVVVAVAAEIVGYIKIEFLVEYGIVRYLCDSPITEENN